MKFTHRFLSLASAGLLAACAVTPTVTVTPAPGTAFQTLAAGFVSDYILKVQDQFTIQSVKSEHQSDVDTAVASFEADLTAAQLSDYYQTPGFTIKLSAGSEGSALSAGSEGSAFNGEALSQRGAVYAQAVVFNDNLPQA